MIQAALAYSDSMFYLFRGDRYVGYEAEERKVAEGPQLTVEGWPGLEGTQFAAGLDTGLRLLDGLHLPSSIAGSAARLVSGRKRPAPCYLFKTNQYAQYDIANKELVYGPRPLNDWSGFAEHGFDRDLDAATDAAILRGLKTEWFYWFFKGDRCLKYDAINNKVLTVGSIGQIWPALKRVGFDRDLDAAVTTAEQPHGYGNIETTVHFFKGDQHVAYDYAGNTLKGGVKSIADALPGLEGTDFATGQVLPSHTPTVAHAQGAITFSNPGESGVPEPYGKIWLVTKDGATYRLWTQVNHSVPSTSSATIDLDLPFGADQVIEIAAHVDESDSGNGDDYLARGTTPFTGNGTYTLGSDDGKITVELTIT